MKVQIALGPILGLLTILFLPGLLQAQHDHWFQSIKHHQHLFSPSQNTHLTDQDDFILLSEKTGLDGIHHQRFQRKNDGLQVLGEHIIVHTQGDELTANGSGLKKIPQLPSPIVSEEKAREKAAQIIQSHLPGHQIATPTFKKVELVIADVQYPQLTGHYTKAWLIEVKHGHEGRRLLIDAYDGRAIMDINRHLSCHEAHGTTSHSALLNTTLYHGERDINGRFLGPNEYALVASDTQDKFQVLQLDSSHFVDDDGYYEEGSLAHISGALDAFWATELTLKFLDLRLGRKGIWDNEEDTLTSFIFPIEDFYNNAFWDGEAVYYGTGDQSRYGPFTSMDICTHEIFHGVTEFTSGLEYTYESGALNEAFSDIFGKALERYFYADASWELGDRIAVQPGQGGFRSMNSPNDFGDPGYYKGRFWHFNRFDNGGVHSNSGVLNHWFYLLIEGGTGTNEGGEDYDVEGMDMDYAVDLCFELLTNYLTPTSQYIDARNASMEIAKNMFGECSARYHNVMDAWHAVGLWTPSEEEDLALIGASGQQAFCEGQPFHPTVEIANAGCSNIVLSGRQYVMSYAFNNQPPVIDTFTLDRDLAPGEKVTFSFDKPVIAQAAGYYRVTASMSSLEDPLASNNNADFIVELRDEKDFDIEITPIFDNRSPCERGTSVSLFILGEYLGCTSILHTDTITMTAELNGEVIIRKLNPFRSAYAGSFIFFDEVIFDQLKKGANRLRVSFDHAKDPDADNNWHTVDLYVIDNIVSHFQEHFDDKLTIDSSLIGVTQGKWVSHSVQNEDGADCFGITASGLYSENGDLRLDTSNLNSALLLLSYPEYQSTINLCFDSEKFISPVLEFRVKRSQGNYDHEANNFEADKAALISVNYDHYTEYLDYLPWDEFETLTYNVTDLDTIQNISLRNFTLHGEVDSLTGEITSESDRIFYDYIILRDISVPNQNINGHDYTIFPNPTSTYSSLIFDQVEEISGWLEIVDQKGRVIERHQMTDAATQFGHHAPPGSYTLLFRDETSSAITAMKWIKIR